MRPSDRPLPDRVLDRRVDGYHVPEGATLRDLLDVGDEAVLVVFLRHYG